MAVKRGEGADEAATRFGRHSEPLLQTQQPTVRRLCTPQPALMSAVVLILFVSGMSPSSSSAPSTSVARSAPTTLGDPFKGMQWLCLRGGGSREQDEVADVPGQVRPQILTAWVFITKLPEEPPKKPPSCLPMPWRDAMWMCSGAWGG